MILNKLKIETSIAVNKNNKSMSWVRLRRGLNKNSSFKCWENWGQKGKELAKYPRDDSWSLGAGWQGSPHRSSMGWGRIAGGGTSNQITLGAGWGGQYNHVIKSEAILCPVKQPGARQTGAVKYWFFLYHSTALQEDRSLKSKQPFPWTTNSLGCIQGSFSETDLSSVYNLKAKPSLDGSKK